MADDLSDALTILKQLLLEPWESQYLINKPLFTQGRWKFSIPGRFSCILRQVS